MDHRLEMEKLAPGVDGIDNPLLDDMTAEAQYAIHIGKSNEDSPEKRLLVAMLSDALECVCNAGPSRASAEALDWILEDDVTRFCSFVNVCETLGLEPSLIRRKVLESVAWSFSVTIPVATRTRKQRIPVRVAA